MKKELLRVENLKKGTLLKRIELQVFEGEIIHCIFDNEQEKNLFMEIITGRQEADCGHCFLSEERIPENKIPRLLEQCVEVISMNTILIESVTIEENLFLIRPEVKEQWVNRNEFRKKTQQLFEEFMLHIDIDKSISQLNVLEKVQIEIMKAYLLGKKIIILTAICNCLSNSETKKLWTLLQRLQRKGVSFVVAEPLEDVDFAYTDTVVVVKNGKTCIMKDVDECDYTMLHTVLYRKGIEKSADDRVWLEENSQLGQVKIQNLSTDYLESISLTIKRGEIVKLFCIDERSFEEMVGFVNGAIEGAEGLISFGATEMEINGKLQGVKDHIGVVDGNPAIANLFTELTAMDNLQMLLSQKASGIWMIPKYKRSIQRLLGDIIPNDVYEKKVKELSPSQIQKIVYSRWLLYSPKLLICIQPFAEGDVQAREAAREMLYILESRKIPVLIITANTTELNYCRGKDVYMRHGKMISKEEAYDFLYTET